MKILDQTLTKTINSQPTLMMKKTLSLIAFAVSSFALNAQDILVRKSGEAENVKVLEISPTEIKFKKSNNPDGPTFIEKRSNLYSIKYQNGEVQLFNEKVKSEKTRSLPPSIYTNPPKFTHEAELFIGDGWGAGYQLRKDFNPYIGWDILGVSYMSYFESPGEIGLVNIRPLGIKGYTPAYKAIRGFTGLKLGYSFGYEKYYYYDVFYINNQKYYERSTSYEKGHFFGLDFSLGVQFHKNFAIGYNLNFITNSESSYLHHMAKISILF